MGLMGDDAIGRRPERLRDHWWWRPGWRQGRSMYTFHVTFDGSVVDGAARLRGLAERYQRALSGVKGLDMVPAQWLHLTVQGVGFTDEVAESEMRAIVASARTRCADVAPFNLRLGPAVVFREGASLPGAPAVPARRMRDALRAAIADVRGEAGVAEGDHFLPHVSLAYSAVDGSAERLTQAVDSCILEPVSVAVRGVSLIALDRDARIYRWTTHARVRLRGHLKPADGHCSDGN